MKKNPIEAVCQLLAASGFSEADIFEMLRAIQQASTTELESRIRSLRRQRDPRPYELDDGASERGLFNHSSGPLERVEYLLRKEARLSTSAAARALGQEVADRFNLSLATLPRINKS